MEDRKTGLTPEPQRPRFTSLAEHLNQASQGNDISGAEARAHAAATIANAHVQQPPFVQPCVPPQNKHFQHLQQLQHILQSFQADQSAQRNVIENIYNRMNQHASLLKGITAHTTQRPVQKHCSSG